MVDFIGTKACPTKHASNKRVNKNLIKNVTRTEYSSEYDASAKKMERYYNLAHVSLSAVKFMGCVDMATKHPCWYPLISIISIWWHVCSFMIHD